MSARTRDLSLSETLHELQRRYGRAPLYQNLWSLAASARVPAHRDGNRWKIQRADLPAVAATLGLSSPDRAA